MRTGSITRLIEYISMIFVIAYLVLSAGCANSYERTVVRILTEEEMAAPRFRYQQGINMELTQQVAGESPGEKPQIEWSKRDIPQWNTWHVMTDRESCVWYPVGQKIAVLVSGNTLMRVNPDGTQNLKLKCSRKYPALWPVLMTNDAVICYQVQNLALTDSKSEKKGLTLNFKCLNLKGKTIWQTESFQSGQDVLAWRLSNNRFMAPVGEYDGEYNIYSLSNGELLQNFKIPRKTIAIRELGPVETNDGGWITYTYDEGSENQNITRFNQDLSIDWNIDSDNDFSFDSPFMLSTDVLVSGGRHKGNGNKAHLYAIDMDGGRIIWQKDNRKKYLVHGITPDRNLIVETRYSSYNNETCEIQLWTPDGDLINAFPIPGSCSYEGSELIVYEDGKFLFGHLHGLSLANQDGLIWTLNKYDLGYPDSGGFLMWTLNPTPDGRIVVSFWAGSKNYEGTQILSLASSGN